MISRIHLFLTTAIAWFGAAILFVLSPAVGSISSVAGVVLTVLLSPVVFLPGAWRTLRTQPAMPLFLAAFVSLAICFAVTAWQPSDALMAANFLGLLLAPVVFLLATRRPGTRTIASIAALCLAGAAVGALTSTYDVFIQHKDRAIGWASGGNLMARSVVPLGFMALCGVLALRSRWRCIYLLGPAFGLYALVLTQTRGVFLAVPVLALLFIWAFMRELRAPRALYVVSAVGVVLALGAVMAVSPRFLALGGVLEQVVVNTANVTDSSTSQRIAMWAAGWHAFFKSPMIGWGWAHLHDAALPYELSFYHNDFFDVAVAAGVIGIASWLAVIAAPVLGAAVMPTDRYSNLRLYCALLLSGSFFIFGLTDMTLGYDLPTTLYPFMTAVVLGAFRETPTP